MRDLSLNQLNNWKNGSLQAYGCRHPSSGPGSNCSPLLLVLSSADTARLQRGWRQTIPFLCRETVSLALLSSRRNSPGSSNLSLYVHNGRQQIKAPVHLLAFFLIHLKHLKKKCTWGKKKSASLKEIESSYSKAFSTRFNGTAVTRTRTQKLIL